MYLLIALTLCAQPTAVAEPLAPCEVRVSLTAPGTCDQAIRFDVQQRSAPGRFLAHYCEPWSPDLPVHAVTWRYGVDDWTRPVRIRRKPRESDSYAACLESVGWVHESEASATVRLATACAGGEGARLLALFSGPDKATRKARLADARAHADALHCDAAALRYYASEDQCLDAGAVP